MVDNAQLIFTKPVLRGLVTTVGSVVKKFTDDAKSYNLSEKDAIRLSKSLGLNERRVVASKDTTTSDLCVQSAQHLFDGLGITPNSVSGIIFVTQSPDYAAPSTAMSIQDRLGMSVNSMAFDMHLGCSGFVYGMSVAYSLVESGLSRVLLCVGDVASSFTPDNDHTITPIMGDAGSAILIERGNSTSFFQLYSDGSGARALYIPNSGCRINKEDQDLGGVMRMNGAQVFNFTLQRVPSMIDSILNFSNSTPNDVDYFILHQPNKYILNNIQKRLSVSDDKFPKQTQSIFGNQNSASIPGTISGFLSAQYSNTRLKSLFAGFGIGLSWASCVIETDHIFSPEFLIERPFNE